MSHATTQQALKLIEELEYTLADFYAAAAQLQPGNAAFWLDLVQEERQHGSYVQKMIGMIETHPERFHANRAFNLAAIQTFAAYVKNTTSRLISGEVPAGDEKYFLALARDMEQSVIEAKFNEIVKTADVEFQALMRQVVADTLTHKNRIIGRLAGRPAR
jgi:rubrerythrin